MQHLLGKQLSREVSGEILHHVPLSRHTTLHVGGIADMVIYPANLMELQNIIGFSQRNEVPYCIIGGGSNLVVRDGGIRGVVINLSRHFTTIKVAKVLKSHVKLLAGAGVTLKNIISFTASRELSGMEFASGIPGLLGGALAMNAGAQGKEIRDITERVTLVTPQAEVIERKRSELDFRYRTLELPVGTVIAGAVLTMKQGRKETIARTIKKINTWRRQTQPIKFPSAGSIFKNPPGKAAGELLEEAGLKGLQFGKAQISEKHANFIVNRGGATAGDILSLMDIMQQTVYRKTGIRLEPEVQIVGENRSRA